MLSLFFVEIKLSLHEFLPAAIRKRVLVYNWYNEKGFRPWSIQNHWLGDCNELLFCKWWDSRI